jgi:hypothetical protein
MMLLHTILGSAFFAKAFAHSTHHVEQQQPLTQERLDELERKWGIDVSS